MEKEEIKKQEKEITNLVAETAGFEVKGDWATCKHCKKRLWRYTYGQGSWNERMQDHAFYHHHIGVR